MRDPTWQEVTAAILQGIRNAQADYKKAYESHINSEFAPEYLMTTYIFQSILQLKEKTCGCAYGISLEEPVYNLIRNLREVRGLETRGRYLESARVYGNCDLSLRDIEHDEPRAVIEVKKDPRNYWEDITRLSYMVRNGLEFGVFASYWSEEVKDSFSEEADDRIDKRIGSIHSRIKDDIVGLGCDFRVERELGPIDRFTLIGEKPDQKEEWQWCPVCFVVRH